MGNDYWKWRMTKVDTRLWGITISNEREWGMAMLGWHQTMEDKRQMDWEWHTMENGSMTCQWLISDNGE